MIPYDVEFIDFRDKYSIYCRRQRFVNKNMHCHAYYEIELAVNGVGEHIINNETYHEAPGDIFLMRLMDVHSFNMESESEHWVIEIPPSAIPEDVIKMITIADGNIITHLSVQDFVRAKELYMMIEECNGKSDVFCEKMRMYMTVSLIMLILKNVDDNMSEKLAERNIQIREIITYIHDNIFEDLSISNIAAKFFVSKEYLSAFFKKNVGITISSYVRKTRLSYAAKLIVSTNKKIVEICEMSGFNSLPTFLRTFKNEYGITPTEMRQGSRYMNDSRDDR